MNALSSRGVVLRRTRHLENDIRLTVLLRDHGKVFVVSKGGQKIQSRMKGLQEPFSEAEFHVYAPPHGSNARLAGGKLIDSHRGLRANITAFEIASRCCEVVDMMVPFRAPSPDVYDILRRSLHALQATASHQIEWIFFVARLFECLGHGDISVQVSDLLRTNRKAALALVDSELERVLPWRLKTESLAGPLAHAE